MGMNVEAHLAYGVVIEREHMRDNCWDQMEEILYKYPNLMYTACGHPDASERFVLYDGNWSYSVEWDDVYLLQPGDLEAVVDVIKLCSAAKELGMENPEPGWHLVAYYG